MANPTVEKLRDAIAHLRAAAESMRVAEVEAQLPDTDRRISKILAHVENCADATQGLHQVLERGAGQ